jgi:hypothetical protein
MVTSDKGVKLDCAYEVERQFFCHRQLAFVALDRVARASSSTRKQTTVTVNQRKRISKLLFQNLILFQFCRSI